MIDATDSDRIVVVRLVLLAFLAYTHEGDLSGQDSIAFGFLLRRQHIRKVPFDVYQSVTMDTEEVVMDPGVRVKTRPGFIMILNGNQLTECDQFPQGVVDGRP